MQQTPIYAIRYPDLGDPADIIEFKTLAEDVEAALEQVRAGRSLSRTYEVVNSTYFYVNTAYQDAGSTLRVDFGSVPGWWMAVATFELRNLGATPGLVAGYLAVDGVTDTTDRAVLEGVQHRATVAQCFSGQVSGGAHQFSLQAKADAAGYFAHHWSKLAVVTIQ